MKNKTLLITIVLIILIGSLAYLTLNNKIIVNSVNSSNLEDTNSKKYNNSELGISFNYPKSFGLPRELELTNNTDQSVYSGRGIEISFNNNPEAFNVILASLDFEKFKTRTYRTVKDKDDFCPIFNEFNIEKSNYCHILEVDGRESFAEYRVETDEGVVFVIYSVYVDINKNSFTGATISTTFVELSETLQKYIDFEELLKKNTADVINNLANESNLSANTLDQLTMFKQVIASLNL